MNPIRTLYIRNILRDLWASRAKAAAFTAVCIAVSIAFAMRPGTPVNLTDGQKEELAAYEQQLDEYDAAISDIEASIRENDRQTKELRTYVDNSIYMHLDPDNIQTATVQYGLQTEGNVGNILNSFITYINDGGLRESVPAGDADLQPEYWRDVVSSYINSNILNITVLHYDADRCARIMNLIKQRLQEQIPEIQAVQGGFTLTEMESTQYVKADAGIVNTQNGYLNSLKGFETSSADLHNRLISYRNNKSSYMENNAPDFASDAEKAGQEESRGKRVMKYALAGILFGLVLSCAVLLLRYIISDRLRSKEDLRDTGLNVLGSYHAKRGYGPEIGRSVMDVKMLAETATITSGRGDGNINSVANGGTASGSQTGRPAVYLSGLHDDEITRKVAGDYVTALAGEGAGAVFGFHIDENADELKQMIAAGSCLLIAQAGKTTFRDLRKQLQICERFRVTVIGCVVIE